jgi:hypothetical protein
MFYGAFGSVETKLFFKETFNIFMTAHKIRVDFVEQLKKVKKNGTDFKDNGCGGLTMGFI